MSLIKRPGSRYWWCEFTAPGLAPFRESTGTADRTEAQEYHDQRRAELWRARRFGQPARTLTADALSDYLEGPVKRKGSCESHKKQLAFMRPWLPDYLDELDTDRLERIRDQVLARRKCSESTANHYLAPLSAMLHFAHKKKKLAAVPAIPWFELVQPEFTVLRPEQAAQLLAELPPHLNVMTRFSLATGLRNANVRELKWSEVDLGNRVVWVWARRAKARKMIGVALSDSAIEVLQGELGRHSEFVFTYAKIGREGKVLWRRPLVRKSSNGAWYKAVKRAGLEGLRWHDLRHAWATWQARAGTSMLALQAMGGWASGAMVQRYAHLAGQQLHAEANRIVVPNVAPRAAEAGGMESTPVQIPVQADERSVETIVEEVDLTGVDDGIRTHNNRNHKRRQQSQVIDFPTINQQESRPKTAKRRA